MPQPTSASVSKLEQLEQSNPRYSWLRQYLQGDPTFLSTRLHPILQGRTRVVVADFWEDAKTPASISSFDEDSPAGALRDALTTQHPQIKVRLVLATSTSGVGGGKRKEQLWNTSDSNPSGKPELDDAPVLTRPRVAGVRGQHPIPGHLSYLLDPQILNDVQECLDLDPGIVLQFLDQNTHLHSPILNIRSSSRGLMNPVNFRLALDQSNHLTAVVIPTAKLDNYICWTVVILAAEDDCLGIDFNPTAPAMSQVLRSSMDTISATIEASLHRLTEQQRRGVCNDPKTLVWLYTDEFVQAVACHIELFRREWNILYEPYSNISTVYGNAVHRDRVRRLAKEYSQHIRYLNTSLESLRRHLPSKASEGTIDPWWGTNSILSVGTLVSDLSFLVQDLEALKASCNQFLEQQVSRLSLQEARMSIQEAKDLKRLSYVAFVFAPLSLASSFFGMNVQPLDGSTPLWIFIVIALATLLFSTGIIILASSAKVMRWWNNLKGPTHIKFHERSKPFQPDTENRDGDDGKPTAGHTVSTTTTQVLQESFAQDNTVEFSAVEVKTKVRRQPVVTRVHPEVPPAPSGRGLHGKVPMNDRLRRQVESQVHMQSASVYIPLQRTEYEDPPTPPLLPTIMSSSLISIHEDGVGIGKSPQSQPISDHISTTRSQASTNSSEDKKRAPSVKSTKTVEDGVGIGKSPQSQAISDHIPDDTKAAPSDLDARSQRSFIMSQIEMIISETLGDGESGSWTADSVTSDEICQVTTVVSEKQDDDESNARAAADSVESDEMQTRLYNAFLIGDELRIQELFDTENCDSNSIVRFTSYNTLIYRAAVLGNEKIVRLLLERGADPNKRPTSSWPDFSALAEAAEHGNPSLVRLLVDAGADVNAYGVVYAAAHSGSLDTLKLLVEAGADINVENTCGFCSGKGHSGEPLGVAAHMGHTEVVRFLLDSKITLDHVLIPPESKGEDALGEACQAGNEEAALLINDAGVAMSYLNVHQACFNDHVAVLKRYIALYPGCCLPGGVLANEINSCAEYGHVRVLEVVLEHGADIEIRVGGLTPLMDAARGAGVGIASPETYLEVVTILLDNGANLAEVTHPEGMTALHFAARAGYGDIVELLLKRGADIASKNQAGESPLHVAAREGKLATVHVLLSQKGVDIRARDNEGWAAAHRAAWNGHRDVLQLLTARDAHLDALTPEGFTVEALLEAYED